MAAESVYQYLKQLTSSAGESAVAVYANWAGLTVGADDSLYRLVVKNLAAHAHSANVRESLEATVRAGGGVGESVEEMLAKTGLVGFS